MKTPSPLHQALRQAVPAPGASFDWPALLALVEGLSELEQTPQDPVHHAEGNVGIHTRRVLDALLADPEYQRSDADRRFVLFMAALLHDICKPQTTRIDPDTGRISQPGHSRKGAIRARQLLWEAGVSFAQREAICRIIAVHQVPFHAFHSRRGDTPERIVRTLSWQLHLPDLVCVARADMRGRLARDREACLQDIELFQALAEEDGCWTQPRAAASAHTRLMYARGQELHLETALFQPEGASVIVLSGLPAVGKNTWVSEQAPDWPVISFDDARAELGLRHGQNHGMATHLAIDRAKALLRKKTAFVWNATHLSEQMRSKTLDLLMAYHAQIRLVYLEVPPAELYRRNSQRDTTLRNKDIERMLCRWEVPLPAEAHQTDYEVSG